MLPATPPDIQTREVAPARLTHGDVLKIAVPITLSNATVPLIGFVDTAIIGQLGHAHLMGAVAIGAVIFNMLYWTFSFLRMGTTGLTAQAIGAHDKREIAGHLLRALMVAVSLGLLLILAQRPVRSAAFWLTGGSPEVISAASIYFDIRIWAAPAGLTNFALLGWFIGQGRAGMAFVLQLLLNIVNMALALLFVMGLDGGIAGVGWAAFIAENVAAVAGIACARAVARDIGAQAPFADAFDAAKLRRVLAINIDFTIRSLAGFVAIVIFTSRGAAAGDVTLAANGLLVNIQNITIYLLDGFAFACEALVGRAIGARNRSGFWRSIELTTVWAFAFALLLALFVWIGGAHIISFSARNEAVQIAAFTYLPWAALAPVVGVWCFQLDGVFSGATRTADMRNMMLLSLAIFLLAYAILSPSYGNHGLWAAFTLFYVVRAATLLARMPALVHAAFGSSKI